MTEQPLVLCRRIQNCKSIQNKLDVRQLQPKVDLWLCSVWCSSANRLGSISIEKIVFLETACVKINLFVRRNK